MFSESYFRRALEIVGIDRVLFSTYLVNIGLVEDQHDF
jgi:hypothetical protein